MANNIHSIFMHIAVLLLLSIIAKIRYLCPITVTLNSHPNELVLVIT
jgi:hypothetical protein